jgi:hypothetical protein
VDIRRPLVRATAALTVALALIPVGVYVWIAAHRIGYPYELDWLEGGAVGLVNRVLHGQSLYVAPTLRYVGWAYPPLYTWVSAAVAEVTGVGFLPLRLVSFASSLVAIGALGWIVYRETRDWVAAVVAAGLFAACYRLTGSWFDVGRLDSMFVALTLVAIGFGQRARGVRGGVALGVLAFLAFFTKQSALIALVPALAWMVLTRRRRTAGIAASVVLVVLVGGSTLILDALTDNWYRYYVISELGGQSWAKQLWLGFWRYDLLEHLWPLAALLVVAGGGWLRRGRPDGDGRRDGHGRRDGDGRRDSHGYLLAACAGLLLAAWSSRLHTGGYLNVLMPAYAACALLGGLAVAALRRRGSIGAVVALIMVAGQLALLAYPIGAQIPTARDRAAGAQLEAAIKRLPGPVLVLRHPWYGTLAGKGSFAQSEGIVDVLRSISPRGAHALGRALHGSLNRYGIRAVVLDDGQPPGWLAVQLRQEFVLQQQPITRLRLYPLTDLRSAPMRVYLRR